MIRMILWVSMKSRYDPYEEEYGDGDIEISGRK
jgi:hypothetical protein